MNGRRTPRGESGGLLGHPWSWNVLSLSVSVLVCAALIGLHLRGQRLVDRADRQLNQIRQARQDLANGFLHISLGGAAPGAFDRGQGLALVEQAAELLQAAAAQLPDGDGREAQVRAELPARLAAFRSAVAELDGRAAARQRVAYHALTEAAAIVDAASWREREALDRRLERQFAAALVIAGLMLGGLTGGIFRVAKLKATALREMEANERRLFLFVESAPAALAMLDRELRYVGVSRRWRDDYGLGDQPLTGRLHYELFPEIGEDWKAVHRRALGGETIRREADRFERKDGSVQWLRWEVAPWHTATGTVGGIVIFTEDITDRQLADEARARLAAVVESSDDAIHGKTLDGIITSWNRGAEQLFGYAAAEIVGQPALRLFPPERADEEKEILQRVASGGSLEHFETVRVHRDGRRIDVSVTISPIRDQTGRVIGASQIARDIGERKRAELALRESEVRTRAIIESLSEGIVVTDLDGTVQQWNPAAREMLGFASDAAMRGRLADLSAMFEVRAMDGELLPPEQRPLRRTVRGETIRGLEVRIRRRGAAERIFRYNGTVVRPPDGRALAYLAIEDVTEARRAEEALRLSEMKFASAFDQNPAAIALTRLDDGVVIEVNDTWVALCGYSRDEIIGRSARGMWPSAAEVQRFVQVLSEQGRVRGWEQAFRKKSGELFYCELSTVLLSLGGERVLLSTLVDVTSRRRAEEALRMHEAVLRETGRIAKVGGWSFDVASGEGYWTDEVARIHDLDPAAGTSREIGLSYYRGENRRRLEAALAAAVERGEPYDLELELVSATGRRKWVRTIGHPLMEQGRVVRLRGSFQDITERKRGERRLATQAAVGRVLAESATLAEATPRILEAIARGEGWQFGAIWEIDPAGERLHCLETWCAPDLQAAELVEETRRRRFAPGEGLPGRIWVSRQVTLIADVVEDAGYVRAATAASAGLRSALAFPIVIDGAVAGVIDFLAAEIREMDEGIEGLFELIGRQVGLFIQRRRAEAEVRRLNAELEQRVQRRTAELEAANKELEAFSYSVSHDLRAPLRAVDGFALALAEDFEAALPPEGQRYLRLVREGAQRMGQLIDDLLAFSRLGRKAVTVRPFGMAGVVQEVLAELDAERAGRELEVVVAALPDTAGDPALVRQVWLNLIGNAFKYTRRRPGARVEIGSEQRGGETVYFVKDNGAGFDMRYAHKLFGVFQRLHRAEEFEGTGVGLAIVQRVVQRHGGRIWAEAEVGRGASFYFTLNPPAGEDR